tara:strand:+ start:25788 stop:26087 length:300 start_codon:yes stop_codon:yes gene_type:complete
MSDSEQQEIRLHGPHPGLLGAAAPIPEELRLAANELDGKTMKQIDAWHALNRVAVELPGVELKERNSCFLATLMSDGRPVHCWRVISFEPTEVAGGNSE